MADEPTPEQVAEMQKKNCIFCRIVAGEIESKKVFENEHYLAILDIRPAVPGHVLLLPKEHVPILPLLPEERLFEYLTLAGELASAVQEAMIAPKVTVFAASGYAAGQQAPHLMLHIIPRDKGDGLEMLDLERMDVPQADTLALAAVFAAATKQALQHRKRDDLTRLHHIHKKEEPIKGETSVPVDTPAGPALVKTKGELPGAEPIVSSIPAKKTVVEPTVDTAQPVEFDTTSEALEAALAMSPDLRRLIIAQPDLVAEYVQRSPKLTKLFEGVNIRALSLMLQRQEAAKPPVGPERVASQMSESELFTFIAGNEGLRTWMLEHPQELAANIGDNPRLATFFKDTDIVNVSKRFRDWWQSRGAA